MPDIAIRIDNLGKQYLLGERVRYRTLRESVSQVATDAWGKLLRRGEASNGTASHTGDSDRTIWALRDVSLEVPRGAVLGIIGRNGAGKSTLLKILSRITEPSEGKVEIHGRVGSLLEVGTGFHPELTGRENVFVNGAILGMTRSEIRRKFDEIVDFAGVERFLDTPVKRYSSGMQVRLAFAVAAHLDPEILVVDEVLAVGDAAFQAKCVRKMEDVAKAGRTVLFVSHNIAAVESLCTDAILLDGGALLDHGDVCDVVSRYLQTGGAAAADVSLLDHPGRQRSMKPVLARIRMLDRAGRLSTQIQPGGDIVFELHLRPPTPLRQCVIVISVYGLRGERLLACDTRYQHRSEVTATDGSIARCSVTNCRLFPGHYNITLLVKSHDSIVDKIDSDLGFEVVPCDVYGTGKMPPPKYGPMLAEAHWQFTS